MTVFPVTVIFPSTGHGGYLLTFLYDGKWQRNKYVGVSLVGKTLAVMGFGKVGSEVAWRAKGLGMHVIAHDPYAPADRARVIGVELVSVDEAMSTADFISPHMPLTPTTSKLFNDETFAKMKKGVRIINVARDGVIDEICCSNMFMLLKWNMVCYGSFMVTLGFYAQKIDAC